MIVAVKCKSLLLKQTLSIFLKDYLGTSDKCDILISDGFVKSKNRIFVISDKDDANISIPFSKEELLESLDAFHKQYNRVELVVKNEDDINTNIRISLEEEISSIMKDYTRKIIDTVRKYNHNT